MTATWKNREALRDSAAPRLHDSAMNIFKVSFKLRLNGSGKNRMKGAMDESHFAE